MARIKFVPKLKESLYHVKVIGAKEKEHVFRGVNELRKWLVFGF